MNSNYDRTGDAYLQVRADPRYSRDLKIVKVTQKNPEQPEPGCVVVKIRLKMPNEAFQPLRPEVDVTVPLEHVRRAVEVTTEEVPEPHHYDEDGN